MAKKRMITQDMNFDEQFNKLPVGSQVLFYRFLSITDDCGVIPANEYTLHSMINTPPEIKKNYSKLLQNILDLKLMYKFTYLDKEYLCFKRHSFEDMQKFLIKNRTRSEYTKLQLDDYFELYSKLQEFPVNYKDIADINIEIKNKDKDKEGAKNKFLCLFENSEFYDFAKFKESFLKNDKYSGYDVSYYYEAVKNWSASNNKMKKDWIATAHNFALTDNNPKFSKNGNVEMIKLPD